MATTYVRQNDPNQVLGTFTDEQLAMKNPNPGMANMTEGERAATLGWVPQTTQTQDPAMSLQDRFKASGMTADQFVQDPNALKNTPYTSQDAYKLLSGGIITTSEPAENYKKNGLDELAQQEEQLKAEIEARNKELDEAALAEERRIRNTYGVRREALKTEQTGEKATSDTMSFRLGVKDTFYGENRARELAQAQARQMDLLRQEEEDLITRAKAAIREEKFASANKLKEEARSKFEQRAAIAREARAREAQDLEMSMRREQMAMDKQKFEFEVQKAQQEMQAKPKPLILSPGESIFDPETFELLGKAPERPTDNKPITEKFGNNIVQWNPTTSSWDVVYQGDNTGTSEAATDWALAISKGTADLNNVPQDLRSQVVSALNSIPPDPAKIEPLKQKVTLIDDLLRHPGMNSSVGTNWLTRGSIGDRATGLTQDFTSKVQLLTSQETLNTLLALKKQGGTLGALSDGERKTLEDAATKINNWAIKKEGNVVGYNTSEKSFKAELNRLKDLAQKAINEAGGGKTVESATKALQNHYVTNPNDRQFIEQLKIMKNPKTNLPYSDDEIAQALGISFSKVGGDTNTATQLETIPDGKVGGECGRFVNRLSGLGVGDSYASKMAKMDKTISYPEPGMVFVMPFEDTGHIGFILSVDKEKGVATVKDSNWGYSKKVKTHQIPISKMTGFRRVDLNKLALADNYKFV